MAAGAATWGLDRAAPSSGGRIPGVEGLRGVAVASVITYHVWLLPSDGRHLSLGPVTSVFRDLSLGVLLFFTLSGFLLYRPFAAALLRAAPRPSIARYARNRVRRIVPAYWFVLAAAFVLGAMLLRTGAALRLGRIDDLGLLLETVLLLQHHDPDAVLVGIGPTWSLSVEVVFYVVLALVVVVAGRLASRARTNRHRHLVALGPAVLLLAVGLAGKVVAARAIDGGPAASWNADWGGVLGRSFLVHADLFAFGMALAVLHVDAEDERVAVGDRARAVAAVAAVAGYAVVATTTTTEQLTQAPQNTLMALVCTLGLALVVLPRPDRRPSLLVRSLEARPMVALGLISYSAFLWNEPLIRSLGRHGLLVEGRLAFFPNLALVGAVTVVLSTLTYRFVEAPFLRRKDRSPAVVEPGARAGHA